jgi:surface antigen
MGGAARKPVGGRASLSDDIILARRGDGIRPQIRVAVSGLWPFLRSSVRRGVALGAVGALSFMGLIFSVGPAAAGTGGYPWVSAVCQTKPLTHDGVQYCPDDNWVYNGSLFDQWGDNYRNCTSWVAWRLSTNNGYTMPHAIGDASAWGTYFTNHGHAPNNQPAPGAIAWEPHGDHVAYVESVSSGGSKVTISEYNEAYYPGQPTTGDGLYDTRTVPAADFEYIHLKDLSASPPEITTSSLPQAEVTKAYGAGLSATGGMSPYTWAISSGSLPAGLSMAADGTISGVPEDTQRGTFAFTVKATGANGLSATAALQITVAGNLQLFYPDTSKGSLRHAWWTGTAWDFETLDGPGSVMSGHTSDHVGAAVGVTEVNGDPQVYYHDSTAGSLRHAWWTGTAWRFETLDGPGSAMTGHTSDHVGTAVNVSLN